MKTCLVGLIHELGPALSHHAQKYVGVWLLTIMLVEVNGCMLQHEGDVGSADEAPRGDNRRLDRPYITAPLDNEPQ